MFEEPYYAQVTIFAGTFPPKNWAFCNGQIMVISQNTALFSLLGTTYGGDGRVTFALPDLRGRVAIHDGGTPELSLGAMGGQESVTLTVNQMPAHNHAIINAAGAPAASSTAGNSADPANHVPANIGTNVYNVSGGTDKAGSSTMSVTLPPTGGSQPLPTLSPYLVMNYIICVYGIFPSRN
jgi:microcystin-dependent protein